MINKNKIIDKYSYHRNYETNIYHRSKGSFKSEYTLENTKDYGLCEPSEFDDLFEQLKNAKESVHITDWFLSPPVALKRPICYEDFLDGKNDYKKYLTFENASRLMDILYLLAKRGVHIYILLF